MMATAAVLWGSVYGIYGEPAAGAIPLIYSIASFISLFVFWRVRRYSLFRSSQLLFSLLLPFFLMLALGGFVQSSGVVLWSLTSPLGALVFAGRRQALGWFAAYLGLVVLGGALSSGNPNNLPPLLTTLFFVGNIGAVSVVAFVLVRAFASEQDLTILVLDRKHKWIRDAFRVLLRLTERSGPLPPADAILARATLGDITLDFREADSRTTGSPRSTMKC
ncbi:MAG: hypothetical protein JRH01_00015 [Deltaproteobacteria bacterium]|nr:hypothetical protein [Deltaproteobacteria bacterium]MBW2392783.1 hypothetical protein [Deltaproteobacteria bacterium]